jgi:hypothetical protein
MALTPLLVALAFFLFYRKKNAGQFAAPSYIYLTYIGMLTTSLFLELLGAATPIKSTSLAAIAYFCLTLSLVFYGCSNFPDKRMTAIITNNRLHLYFEILLITGGIASIIFFAPVAAMQMTGDVAENRWNIATGIAAPLASFGLLNTLMSLFANMFIFSLLFFFLRLSGNKTLRDKTYAILHFFTSLSFVVYVLAYAGRDGVVLWIFSFFLIFSLCDKYLTRIASRMILIYAASLGVLLLVPFFIISVARFSDRDFGLTVQLLSYFGQQVKNFNDMYQVEIPTTHLSGVFPLLSDFGQFFGQNSTTTTQADFDYYFLSQGIQPWVFSTFIGDLLTHLGAIWTALIIGFLAFWMRRVNSNISKAGHMTLSNLIILIMLYQNILWGVFYFRFAPLNYYAVAVLLIACLLRVSLGSGRGNMLARRQTAG